ncbi:MAG: hypothetical protein S4CHLAM6_07960 [Chlamydiae bacterium]|nr:hypothetical protein [Chlamydiota bacterium]
MRISENLNMGRALFSSDGETINGGVTVEDLQDIAKTIAKDYKGQNINVKNIFDVMKQVFNALDAKSSTLEENRRKDIGSGIIHHILNLNRNTEAQAFADRALDLLIEYSIDSIAADTLKPREEPVVENADPSLSLENLDEPSVSLISEQMQHEDSVSRSRLEEATEALTQEPSFSLVEPEVAEIADCDKDDVDQALDEITVPSKAASVVLSKAATQNPVLIEKQAEEATQYIRSKPIDVDAKISQAQGKINECIDQAFERVDTVCDELLKVLENAHALSAATKGDIVATVNKIAEKLIDAVVVAKSEMQTEEPTSVKRESLAKPLSAASVEIPLEGIVANQ